MILEFTKLIIAAVAHTYQPVLRNASAIYKRYHGIGQTERNNSKLSIEVEDHPLLSIFPFLSFVKNTARLYDMNTSIVSSSLPILIQ